MKKLHFKKPVKVKKMDKLSDFIVFQEPTQESYDGKRLSDKYISGCDPYSTDDMEEGLYL